jgi:hypothetical protein
VSVTQFFEAVLAAQILMAGFLESAATAHQAVSAGVVLQPLL